MGKKLAEIFDVIVAGREPAAAVAAWRAAKLGSGTLLLEMQAPQNAEPAPAIDWLGPRGAALCSECGVQGKRIDAEQFKEFRLRSWDLRRDCLIKEKNLAGWIVERESLYAELRRLAERQGASALSAEVPTGVTLADDRVILRFSSRPEISGRILILAGSANCPLAAMTKLTPAAHTRDVAEGVFAEYEAASADTGLEAAVGASRSGQIAVVARNCKRIHLRLIARGVGEPIESQFETFQNQARDRGLLPLGKSQAPYRRCSPGGAALDMDTHVGKRTLLCGAAGGFIAAFSHEELYPTMRSAWLAAEIAHQALAAPLPQDRLADYSAAWRQELADYLRMPNTDLSLLAPLVFNNEQMSKRVARAFLLGQPF